MEILSYKGKLICDQINYVRVAQGSILKNYIIITLSRYKAFSTPRWGLRDQNLYIPKVIATCQQSIQKKRKEKGNNGYMPCCLSFGTCSVSSSNRLSSEKI